MSHDHEAVALAVAALDFELTSDERQRMEVGLAECAECAEIAASHRDLSRLLVRLPVHDASPQVRQRIMRAALVPPRERRWPILLAAAALLALAVAAAGAAGAFRERPPLDLSVVPPSASLPALGDIDEPKPSSTPAPGSSEVVSGAGLRRAAGAGHPRRGRLRAATDPIGAACRRRLGHVRAIARRRRSTHRARRPRRGQRLRVVRGHGVAAREPVRVLAGRVGGPCRSRQHPVDRSEGGRLPGRTDHHGGRNRPASTGTGRLSSRSPAPAACVRERGTRHGSVCGRGERRLHGWPRLAH